MNRPELERSIIGAVLVNNEAMKRLDKLMPSHFDDAINCSVFGQMRTAIEAGETATAISITKGRDFEHGSDVLPFQMFLARCSREAASVDAVGGYAETLIKAGAQG